MNIFWFGSEILLQCQAPSPPQGPWAWHYGMMGGGLGSPDTSGNLWIVYRGV